MRAIDFLRARARRLKHEVRAVELACQDPRTPWYAKVLAGAIVAYALSPIDLVPDYIPVLGQIDDLILIPLGIAVLLRLIPAEVMIECRARARDAPVGRGRWLAAALIASAWVFGVWLMWLLLHP